jgi:hypothetical protein
LFLPTDNRWLRAKLSENNLVLEFVLAYFSIVLFKIHCSLKYTRKVHKTLLSTDTPAFTPETQKTSENER